AASVALKACIWARTIEEAWRRDARVSESSWERNSVAIAWELGPLEWVMVNTNGAVLLDSGKVVAGGLIRDAHSHCSAAFTINIGRCSITCAELRAVIMGLHIVWDNGWRKVELQVDSTTVIYLVEAAGEPLHQHAMEVMDIRDLLLRDWEVRIRHIYREENHEADFLAGIGFNHPIGCHMIPNSDVNLGYFFRYDRSGVSEPYTIILNE
ncbi:Putative ribonuclease H protein At1g65750, partial [Linum perenne]